MRLNGVEAEFWGPDKIAQKVPLMSQSLDARTLPNGGVWQQRGGVARHDAVAWGYARAADAAGVDIVENCEVTGFMIENGACVGVETTKGEIKGQNVGVAVAGHSSDLLAKAGVTLPIHSYCLQAFVTEPLKPCLDCVVMHIGTGVYVSQSDKGELVFGGGTRPHPFLRAAGQSADAGNGDRQGCSICFPRFRQLKLLRQWGGIVDVVPDSSPDHRPGAGEGHLSQLRLGHRRLQGDPSRRIAARPSPGQRRAPCDQPPVRPRPLRHRASHRRGRRLRHRALSRRDKRCSSFPARSAGLRDETEFHYVGEPKGPPRARRRASATRTGESISGSNANPKGVGTRDLAASDLHGDFSHDARHRKRTPCRRRNAFTKRKGVSATPPQDRRLDRSRPAARLHFRRPRLPRLRRRQPRVRVCSPTASTSSGAASNITGRAAFGALGSKSRTPFSTSRATARRTPNVRATTEPLANDLVIRNRSTLRPTAADDRSRVARPPLRRFLPAGFYYKTFLWPHWGTYEPRHSRHGRARPARRRTTTARPNCAADPTRAATCSSSAPGRPGLRRRAPRRDSGKRVFLVDDRAEPGGQLLHRGGTIEGGDWREWAASVVADGRARREDASWPTPPPTASTTTISSASGSGAQRGRSRSGAFARSRSSSPPARSSGRLFSPTTTGPA